MNTKLPTILEVKALAKKLRAQLTGQNAEVGHARSLELVAQQHGFRDWNALKAEINSQKPEDWVLGARVSGKYLSQPFQATIVAVTSATPGWFHLKLDLDEAVDVVTFDSFSNFRKRITGVVGPKGHTIERTSDGKAHLELDL